MDRKKLQKPFVFEKNNRNRGSSLPLILCVGAFLLAFSLALVYTAGLLLAQPNKKVEKERCYQLASTFAREMDRELKKEDSSFHKFADNFLNNSAYNEYNPDNPQTVYHYLADQGEEDSYGRIKMRLYKERNEEELQNLEGTLPVNTSTNADFTDEVKKYKTKTFQNYIFTVEVIAELDEMSYNYATEYFRRDTYGVEFYHTYNGVETKISWDETNRQWKKGSVAEGGEFYEDWQKESAEPICYKYTINNLTQSEYINVHTEADRGADGQGGDGG